MTGPHALSHRAHTLEVSGGAGRITLRVDGRTVAERDAEPLRTVLVLDELGTGLDLAALELERGRVVVICLRPGRIRRCALVIPPAGATNPDAPVVPGGQKLGPRPERLSFTPPVGSRAHRLYRFERDHPNFYAAWHVVVAVAQVALLLLGLKLALGLIPWGAIPWPHLDLPSLPRPDLPSIPLPHLDLPDVTLPGWLKAVLEAKKYWFPILVAVLVASGEAKRRRKRREADAAARPAG